MSDNNIKLNDRVKRSSGSGCFGIVKELKTEVTATSADAREKGLMVTVLWDDGSFSYFAPEALEIVAGK